MRIEPNLPPGRRRTGSLLAVELLLALPVVLGLLLAMIQYSMLLAARQQLAGASREGARVAALGGGLPDVQQAVQNALGTGRLSGATVQATLTDGSGQPLPSGAPVTVVVSLPANQAAPNLLSFLGISAGSQDIVAQTVMRKE